MVHAGAVEFTEEEQRLYMRVHKDAKAEFNRYASLGPIYVARNLLAIMSLLSPLRAICSGGVLRERVMPRLALLEEDGHISFKVAVHISELPCMAISKSLNV